MALTPFLRLQKPPFDTIPWDEAVNGNMDIIDAFTSLYMSVPNFMGVWQNSTAYFVGQNVLDPHVNLIYTCMINHTSMDPPAQFAADRAAHFFNWQQTIPGAPITPQIRNDTGRNKIHNPVFTVAQRGNSFTSLGYTLDRWYLGFVNDSPTVAQETIDDDDRAVIGDESALYYLRTDFTGGAGSSDFTKITQYLENPRRFSGKQITVSFWARADAPKRIGIRLIGWLGTGGGGFEVPTGQSFLLATGWVRYAYTLTIPSLLGIASGPIEESWMGLELWYSGGNAYDIGNGHVGVQSGSIHVWGVQLEIASAVSPLEKPDAATTLADCERFYQVFNDLWIAGYNNAGAGLYLDLSLPTTMRIAPFENPILVTSTTNMVGSTINVDAAYSNHIRFYGIVSVTGSADARFAVTISADIYD